MECNQCGSTQNTKEFYHFDRMEWEWLCWQCRHPIIKDRFTDGNEGESNGQSNIGDFL